MKKQFATYDISLKLKELGFNEPCLGYYYDKKLEHFALFGTTEGKTITNENNDIILSPLWQQSIDFCLKKLESYNPEPYNRRWRIEYYANGDGGIDFGEGDYFYEFKTMEDAILKLIELINKRLIDVVKSR